MKIHIVRSGDTLCELAKKYNIPVERITEANPNIEADQSLENVSKIFIPTGKVTLMKGEEEKKVEEINKPENDYFKQDDEQTIPDESPAYSLESSTKRETFSSSPFYPMQPEPYMMGEHSPVQEMMPPQPPMTMCQCQSSYNIMAANPYIYSGQLNPVSIYPYYFPYPYLSYYDDPYHELQLSYESSSYHNADISESEWKKYWNEKESSSAEG